MAAVYGERVYLSDATALALAGPLSRLLEAAGRARRILKVPKRVIQRLPNRGWSVHHEMVDGSFHGIPAAMMDEESVAAFNAELDRRQPELARACVMAGNASATFAHNQLLVTLLRGAQDADPGGVDGALAVLRRFAAELENGFVGVMYAPLRRVELPDDLALEFPGSITLRAVTDADLAEFHEHDAMDGLPSAALTHETRGFARAHPTVLYSQLPSDNFEAPQRAHDAALAMTLHKAGCVDLGVCWFDVRSAFTGGRGGVGTPRGTGRRPYVIAPEDKEPLEEIAATVSGKMQPLYRLACERLWESECRESPRDAVLDAVSALEPLLVPGSTAELKFRFSTNYASLGARTDPSQRKERFRRAKGLYDARSRVAHGNELVKPGAAAANAATELATVACAALRETIRRLHELAPNLGRNGWDEFWLSQLFGDDEPAEHC